MYLLKLPLFHQIISTLLGCVLAEHANIIQRGISKRPELFVMHLLRMIMVCPFSHFFYQVQL